MTKYFGKKPGLILLFVFIAIACGRNSSENGFSFINTAHLDHLYEEVMIAGRPMAIIHIYADYPDYQWVDVPDEGAACVDDVARAAVFYLYHFEMTGDTLRLNKARNLLDFILYMQAENGLYYNFVYSDLSINITRENSRPTANWWTWRAIWALAEALPFFKETDPDYAHQLKFSIERTFPAIDSILSTYPRQQEVAGLNLPTWLPFGAAADQASVLQLALLAYQRHYPQPGIQSNIEKIAEGIMMMQIDSDYFVPSGMFLSWNNIWHDWGNCQATALLNTVKSSENSRFLISGLKEIDLFHPYLIKQGFLNQFEILIKNETYLMINQKKFPQIAYGIRPLVWANLDAYDITGNEKYTRQAAEIACWLFGKNDRKEPLYNPETGRCFDGINDEQKLNKNSGAESTIEALLTLVMVEKNARCKSLVHQYYQTN